VSQHEISALNPDGWPANFALPKSSTTPSEEPSLVFDMKSHRSPKYGIELALYNERRGVVPPSFSVQGEFMNRRRFLWTGLGTASFLSLGTLRALASSQLQDAMMSQAPMITDNDEFPLEEGGRPDMAGESAFRPAAYGLKLLPYETVLAHLSPFLEESFDMFFIANTATESRPSDLIPHQHMKVVLRRGPGNVFTRNEHGLVNGTTENAIIFNDFQNSDLFKVSSGKGGRHLLTYSGIFRFNHDESSRRIGGNESPKAYMSYSMYIDFLYNNGHEARLAIHGTPAKNYNLLGNCRASEGCLRVHYENAKQIRQFLLSPKMFSEQLPKFDRTQQLPSQELRDGAVPTRPGVKALLITFNGFKNSSEII
jgi:hypothetical protein